MGRALGVLASLVLIVVSVSMIVQGGESEQLFATNTPAASPPSFATNTPAGPTSTPTATPTATSTATPTPTDTPSPTPTPIGPHSYPEGINPLTGLPYPDEESMNRRNLIVKISNFPPLVRPQSGVNQADVVFEVEAEGGVTRFAAIYRTNAPEHVGSVRSARLFELELIQMYNALLAYSGTSEPIQRLILSSEFVYQTFSPLKGDNCPDAGFCRFPQEGVDFEHTLFLDTQVLYDKATQRGVNYGMRARGFAFNETPDPDGLTVNDVFIEWWGQTDARWQYQPETGHYIRFTEGVPHFDAADDQQLWTDNLIIIEVPHVERPDLFPEGANYWSYGIEMWGQGRAYLARDGQLYYGFWRRMDENPGTALQLIYGNNTPMMMKPGRTWVTVVRGLGNQVTTSESLADVPATMTAIVLSATPTNTPTATPDGG